MICAQCQLGAREPNSVLCAICLRHVEQDRAALRNARRVTDDDLRRAAEKERKERDRMAEENAVACPYCGQRAVLVAGAVIYPHRQDLAEKRFFLCEPCGAWVGCHEGTARPLGRLANAELRRLKMAAHAAFDPLWQRGGMTRKAAYGWLAAQLGIEKDACHIGMFDEETCRRVIAIMEAEAGIGKLK